MRCRFKPVNIYYRFFYIGAGQADVFKDEVFKYRDFRGGFAIVVLIQFGKHRDLL